MSIIYVGLPVTHHVRRFHFDRGRRWSAIEHLVLQALSNSSFTAGKLAEESCLPRRVVLEVLIRLMRAGWVELRADQQVVSFRATQRGASIALDDELPVVTERVATKRSFAVDSVMGAVFRRRDLTLLRADDWIRRTKNAQSIVIPLPASPPQNLGNLSDLLGVLFNEDEKLVRVEVGDWPAAERIALFAVRNGRVEILPPRAPASLKNLLLDAAKSAPSVSDDKSISTVSEIKVPVPTARAERQTAIRQDDVILGAKAHHDHIVKLLRRARRHVVIHSTFLRQAALDALLPDIRVAAGRGCRIDILWGQAPLDGSVASSLEVADSMASRLQEAGLGGAIHVHRHSTRSHAKILLADDGATGMTATIGSCNWLYSGFDSFEASVCLVDQRLVGDVLNETAELVRPSDGHIPELAAQLGQMARHFQSRPGLAGNAKVRLVLGDEHDEHVLDARDKAQRSFTVLSHRLGVTSKPVIVAPAAAAALRGVEVKLYYGQHSGPVKAQNATDAQWTFREQGVELVAIRRPRIHAKILLWDNDDAVITSLNWLSADTTARNPRQEIGVSIKKVEFASYLREEFERARTFNS